jgi:hypothetical protein
VAHFEINQPVHTRAGSGLILETWKHGHAITIITVSTKGFTGNVNRVDALNQGWDQALRLQYMASV